ncbi:MAG TPA: CCA tRNA nucleotidyltransferase [Clostridiales bacterium]|nr:CCA tRNA nucleotidyltransferase [Clostridiales bacterium]
MKMNIVIPREIGTALNILNNNGFEAYIVGGCVRDSLLENAPKDWDITTSARTDEISTCFKEYRTINTGLKHGTVTVIIQGMQIEITTYRIDGSYTDNRHPDTVFFTDKIADDLRRRDFTINAMAYGRKGIVDLFGGISDIESRTIRCVGDPDERFGEDGLRILRALRFSSVLGFKIEKLTSESIRKNKELLCNISKERIVSEFNKLLMGLEFHNVMTEYRELVEVFIPEIKTFNDNEWEVILNSMKHAESLTLRLALLLYETGNAERILKTLKYDGKTISSVGLLSSCRDEKIIPDKVVIKKLLKRIGYDNYTALIKFKAAVFKAQGDVYSNELNVVYEAEKAAEEIIANNECYSLKMLDVDGEDLIRAGISRGMILGDALNELLDLVIEGKLENKKEVLLDYIKKFKLAVDK